ncbi:MAG: ATP-binding cassette domain-containing protein [Ruminococcus sp.]|nr:ATP-binding cassette domain-containing protein [Candidatus Copronaster equi]
MSVLKCDNVHMHYDKMRAVNGVSFTLDEGDFLCIIGENGAGKSTLLKGILGLQKINSGKIELGGIEKNQIGFLPQKTVVQKDFPASVGEVVISGCNNKKHKLFYNSADRRTANENMKLLKIETIKNKSFNELSGGQQQRVLLARALCATQKLLLLDEPTAGLDPVVTADMYEIINHLNKEHGVTVIMVSHDIPASIKYADKILSMEYSGNFYGTTSEYLKTASAARMLGGDTDV